VLYKNTWLVLFFSVPGRPGEVREVYLDMQLKVQPFQARLCQTRWNAHHWWLKITENACNAQLEHARRPWAAPRTVAQWARRQPRPLPASTFIFYWPCALDEACGRMARLTKQQITVLVRAGNPRSTRLLARTAPTLSVASPSKTWVELHPIRSASTGLRWFRCCPITVSTHLDVPAWRGPRRTPAAHSGQHDRPHTHIPVSSCVDARA